MKITKKDEELISIATEVARANVDLFDDVSLVVGCALRTKNGKIYKGVNIKTSHSVCAEQVAIGQAFACGERKLDTLVAVKLNDDGKARVVSPCGLCRYIFDKLNLDLNVIVEDSQKDQILKVKASVLMPYPYIRENEEHHE